MSGRRGGLGLVVVLVFLAATVVGAMLHVSTPRAQRFVVQEANGVLASTLEGRVTIDRVGRLGILSVSDVDATLDGPSGARIASVHGLRVGVDALALVRSALFGAKSPLALRVSTVAIRSLDVRLDRDGQGRFELLEALKPRPRPGPRSATTRGVRVVAPRIALQRAWIHGWNGEGQSGEVTLQDVRGAVRYGPDALDAGISAAKISARPSARGPSIAGILQGHVKKTGDAALPSEADLAWSGKVGEVKHSVRASLVNDALDVVVDVPEASPEAIRSVWAASPIDRAVRARVSARGPLNDVALAARANVGDTTIDATGSVLPEAKKAALAIGAHGVDLHEFVASAPRTRLDATADVVAEKQPGGSSFLDVRLDSNMPDLRKVTASDDSVEGSSRVVAEARVDVTKRTLAAHLQFEGAGIARGTTSVRSASLDAHARGALESPKLDVVAQLGEVRAGGLHLASFELRASGNPKASHVTVSARGPEIPAVDAEFDAAPIHGLSVNGFRAVLARSGVRSLVSVRDLNFESGGWAVEDARVEGLGEPLTVTLRETHSTLAVRASTQGIDLGRVGRLANVETALRAGKLAIDSDVRLQGVAGEGHVTLDAAHVESGKAKELSFHADVSLGGRKLSAKAEASAQGAGTVQLEVPELTVGGSTPITRTAWRDVFGSSDVHARLDLAGLAALVPEDNPAFREAQGEVVIDAHLARDGVHDLTPELHLRMTTDRVVLSPHVSADRDLNGALVHRPAPWRIAGVDLEVVADIDGDSGTLRLRTDARDATGPLADLEATLDGFPYADLMERGGHLVQDLARTRFDAQVTVPERRLDGVPPMLRQRYASGRFHANIAVAGTLPEPNVTVAAAIRKARFGGSGTAEPLDVDLSARYDGRDAVGDVKARGARDQRELLNAQARIHAIAAEFFASKREAPVWTGSGSAHLASFPLSDIGLFDDKLVSGKLTGDVSLEDFHSHAHGGATFSVDGLSVGGVSYKAAALRLNADGQSVDASVRIDQADGFIEANARAYGSWGEATVPSLDAARPLDAKLSAKNFRVAALLPFVDRTLDVLDGRLDADARLQLDPRANAVRPSGTLLLSGGTVSAAAGGGDLHDVTAKVTLGEDGTLVLERLTASGVTGHLEATATARLDGLALRSAHGVLAIPSNAAMPLTAGGSEVGNVDGRVEVTATAEAGKAMQINVDVPHGEVGLPEESGGHPQALGPLYKTRLGAHRGDPAQFVLLRLEPEKKDHGGSKSPGASPAAVAIRLSNLQVTRGRQVKIELEGNLHVSPNPGSSVTGQISIKRGGTFDVQGRTFAIESGTVTFQGGDPSNPQVVVKAKWTAPDRTVVTATYTGPLKTGKVTLSSEPALPREEIVQLLLFGSADGRKTQTTSSGATSTAIAALGGEAAAPLNHALNQLGLGAVTAKIDTSESANPKPEVEVQIARGLSMAIAVVLGQPPPGVNPDRTLLTLDWRFLSKWSLATTVGDAGTTIFDLLWQRRY